MLSYKHLLALIFAIAMAGAASAQCSVSNATISNISRTGTTTCTEKFDLDFTMQNNGGNKTIEIHIWLASQYPAVGSRWTYSAPPTAAYLSTSAGTISINNTGTQPTLIASYPYAAGVTSLTVASISRTAAPGGAFQFHLSGVTINNAPCTGSVALNADIWSTNSNSTSSNAPVHCSNQGLNIVAGDPSLSNPIVSCSLPRSLSFNITTESTSAVNVYYSIYKDDNVFDGTGAAIFDPGTDVNVTAGGTPVGPISISASSPFNGTGITYTGNNTPNDPSNFWVVVTYTPAGGTTFSTAKITANACAILPVKLSAFTATRVKDKVSLVWETLSEVNNRGFYIQRKASNEDWKNISFMFSQADVNGNSEKTLRYELTDPNSFSGVSQYRLQQIDMDYKASYSDIRTVKGLGAKTADVLVFPNPTFTGTVNLMFDATPGTRTVQVLDMTGRVIKNFYQVNDANLTISDLNAGMYSIRITNLATATTTLEKVVVTKR